MNNKRRAIIKKIINELEIISPVVESLLEEESDALENLPDGIRDSERGEVIEECAENLECANEALNDALSYLEYCL